MIRAMLTGMRMGTVADSVWKDGQWAFRLLRRHPGFAAAAILTIALGTVPVAATAALTNWLVFRPAPGVTGADRLVNVRFVARDETGDTDDFRLSLDERRNLTTRVKSLSGLAGHTGGSGSISATGVDALEVDLEFVGHEYFEVLGVRMAAGRSFAPEDDRQPAVPVVILGHALAEALFGDPARSPGRALLVNGLPFTVIGVAPPGFRGLKNDQFAQMWLPGASFAIARHVPPDLARAADRIFDEFIGRLAEDADPAQARAELATAADAVIGIAPDGGARTRSLDVRVQRQPGMSFTGANTRNDVTTMMAMFAGGSLLLLVLAGANVGNLLLFRGARRRHELTMRAVLGASRWRLLRAHLIEVSLLSLSGAAVGLGLTWALARVLEGAIVPDAGFLELPIDWRVAGLVLVVVLLVGIVLGGVPVVAASSSGGVALASRSGHQHGRRLRSALTVLQLALSLSLLVGATLLLATIRNLADVDVGFDPGPVARASVTPGNNGYDDARARAFYRDVLNRVAANPAIASVSASGASPIVESNVRERVSLPGRDPARAILAATNNVTTDYFRVLGVPVLQGRTFAEQEVFAGPDGTCGPVMVSESLARQLFGTGDAAGRVLVLPRTAMECEVIGVAADVRTAPAGDWEATLYRPLGRSPLFRYRVDFLARSNGPAAMAIAPLREAVAAIDSAIPLHLPASLAERIEFRLSGQRIVSSVLAVVAALGLLMAAVGLYGLVSETVVDRTRELAIRMVVGAEAPGILATVMRRAIRLAALGITAGIVLSAGLSYALRSQLFGVTTLEPWVYASAASVLAATVLLASLAPAVRAVSVNPIDALRNES